MRTCTGTWWDLVCVLVMSAQVKVLGVRDFNYQDTLEREIWLLDTTQQDPDRCAPQPLTPSVHLRSKW